MANPQMKSAIVNGAVLAGTFIVGLAALEVGLRVVDGVPAAPWADWRAAYVTETRAASANRYDETLGWVLRDDFVSRDLNTIEHGIRKNGPDTALAKGAIVASGDSFTAGSEVSDHESWPAHLEDVLGTPVMNAGVGGYGTDQIILRAELLMDVLKPEIVVLSFFDQDILRAGFSRYGENKPYFVDTPTGIELNHVPVPPPSENKAHEDTLGIFDTLYLPAVVTSALSQSPIFTPPGSTYRKIINDPVAVSCALLERFKKQTFEAGTHLILVLQYGGQIHDTRSPRPGHAELVIDCAAALAIPVVDEFDTIRDVATKSIDDLKSLYVMAGQGTVFGHMSSTGNALVADLIAEAIQELPEQPSTPVDNSLYAPSAYTVPLGNLLTPAMQALDTSDYSNGLVDVDSLWWGEEGYQFATKGPTGEHYLSLPTLSSLEAGRYELALELRAGSTSNVRLQLLHSAVTGVLADIDLDRDHAALTRLGPVQRIGASVKPAERKDGWKDVSFHAAFPQGDVRIIVQFLDSNGNTGLPGDGTDFDIANIRLNGFVAP